MDYSTWAIEAHEEHTQVRGLGKGEEKRTTGEEPKKRV